MPKPSAKTTKQTKSKKATKVTETPVQEAAPVPETVTVQETAPVAENAEWTQLEEQFKEIIGRVQEFRTWSATLQSDVRRLQKNVQRHLRDNARKNKRRKKATGDKPKRAPSGFAKPALISDELCAFLGTPKGTEMARTEVTKHLTQYIKNNSLQDQANRRKIIPDKKLGKLLGVSKEDEVTYFNLQKYMKVHFPKSASQIAA